MVKDFFISYNSADKGWAEWIAWQLEEVGYTTILQAWDFRPGHNFVLQMDRASQEAERIIIVLSHDFLSSSFTPPEWAVFFKKDPKSDKGLIVPVRVRKCELGGLLSTISRIDLIGLEEEAAKQILLDGINFKRAKPTTPPGFPGSRSVAEKPRFPGSLPPVWNVPFNRNPNFTGRRSLLIDLHDALNSGQYAALTQAITGLGGVGKTQLALEYVYSYIDDYEIVWWVRSEELSTLASDYFNLAGALNLPESRLADQTIVVGAVRRKLGQLKSWLLIFDNATKPENIDAYLPQSGGGHVIITSRNQDWDVLAREMPIRVFEEDEAVEFIIKRTGEEDTDSAKELAKELDNLPLALEQACAYIKTRNKSIAGYLELLRQRKTELLKFPISRKDYDYTVATTWEISFQQVQEESEAGAEMLNLCAFLAPEKIPRSLISGGAEHLPEPLASAVADELRFDDALAAPKRYSLLTVADEALSVHRLVQAVTRDRLSDEVRKIWADAAVRLVKGAFPYNSNDIRTWSECLLLLPHALAAAGHAEVLRAEPKATQQLLNRAGVYLMGRAEFGEAKALYKRALHIAENIFGQEHDAVATISNNLGLVLQDMGDLESAKECYERALTIGEKVYGSDHPKVDIYVNNLGLVLQDMGDLDSAKKCYERALTIGEKAYGSDHPQVAIYISNLGRVQRAHGNFEGAKETFKKALKIGKTAYGFDHPQVAIYVNNLGEVLQAQGDFEGAKKCFERALKIGEMAYGPEHPKIAVDFNNLASVLNDMQDLDNAKRYIKRALEIGENVHGTDHPQLAIYFNTFGMVLRNQRDLVGAKKCFERALKIGEMAYGPDHTQVAIYVNNLGIVLQEMGDLDGAMKCFERAFQIFRKKLGDHHPNTVKVRNNLNSLSKYPRKTYN